MRFSKTKLLVLFITIIGYSVFAQKQGDINTKPYPYGNPVITHMYTADPAPRVMPDGRVWMVTSVDNKYGGGFLTMHKYHAFSSADMVNWVDHGEIFNLWDALQLPVEPKNENWALWAPDFIYRNGKYYLYYPLLVRYMDKKDENGKPKSDYYTVVAVSDSITGPYEIMNKRMHKNKGIDPSVFIDDDGQAYLYYGEHFGGKLKANMIEFESEPKELHIGENANFMEAFWMHKHDEKYYINYHTKYGRPLNEENPDDSNRVKSKLDYVVGDSPLGNFEYRGVLNYELGVNVENGPKYPGKSYVPWRLCQSNHGGIVEFHGQEYLFYHTSALSSWRKDEFKERGSWHQRSVCIDKVNYDENGIVIPVKQTIEGVDKVSVKQAFSIPLDKKKVKLQGAIHKYKNSFYISKGEATLTYSNINLGTGYYYFGIKVDKAVKGKVEVRLDGKEGKLLGTIRFDKASKTINNGVADTFLRGANGKHTICLVVINEGKGVIQFSEPEFFAGAPHELKYNQIYAIKQ